jgi:hypothetical protein
MMDRKPRSPAGWRAVPPPDAKDLEVMARRACLERGIVILWPDRIRDDWDRQHVLNLAKNLYGPRHDSLSGK